MRSSGELENAGGHGKFMGRTITRSARGMQVDDDSHRTREQKIDKAGLGCVSMRRNRILILTRADKQWVAEQQECRSTIWLFHDQRARTWHEQTSRLITGNCCGDEGRINRQHGDFLIEVKLSGRLLRDKLKNRLWRGNIGHRGSEHDECRS